MCNEELVMLIQRGHTEYYAELWENTRRLICKLIYQYIRGRKLPNYVDTEDAMQCGYFAMCGAVRAYKADEEYKFTTYLNYQVKCAVDELIGRSDTPSIAETSYNELARGKDGEEKTERIELIEDERAEECFTQIELSDLQRTVWQAVGELPDNEREAITRHYLKGEAYKTIAAAEGVTGELIRARANKGISILRHCRSLRSLYGEFADHYAHIRKEWQWEISPERYAILRDIESRRQSGEYISYGKAQAAETIAKQKYIKNKAVTCRSISPP